MPTTRRRVAGLMCRNTLSVGWDGRIYDCDFNQMLELDARYADGRAGAHPRLRPARAWRRARSSPRATASAAPPAPAALRRRHRMTRCWYSLLALSFPAICASPGRGRRRRRAARSARRRRSSASTPPGRRRACWCSPSRPDKLIGWTRAMRPNEAQFFAEQYAQLPELGRLTGRGNTANVEVRAQGEDRPDRRRRLDRREPRLARRPGAGADRRFPTRCSTAASKRRLRPARRSAG